MANKIVLTLTPGSEAVATLNALFLKSTTAPREEARSISDYFAAAASGQRNCSFDVQVNGGTAASGTVSLASFAAADTVTLAGTVLTGVASGATGPQFNIGASDTATAVNLAALINSYSAFAGVCTATSLGAVVSITAAVVGAIGDQIPLAISAGGTVSGAKLAGGVNTVPNVYHHGL